MLLLAKPVSHGEHPIGRLPNKVLVPVWIVRDVGLAQAAHRRLLLPFDVSEAHIPEHIVEPVAHQEFLLASDALRQLLDVSTLVLWSKVRINKGSSLGPILLEPLYDLDIL